MAKKNISVEAIIKEYHEVYDLRANFLKLKTSFKAELALIEENEIK